MRLGIFSKSLLFYTYIDSPSFTNGIAIHKAIFIPYAIGNFFYCYFGIVFIDSHNYITSIML